MIPNNGHLVNIFLGEAECKKFGENTEDVSGNVLAYFIQAVSLNVENIRPTDRKSIPNICTSYRSSCLYLWLTGLCWIADSLAAVRPKRFKIKLADFFPLGLREREKGEREGLVLCFKTMSKNDWIITLTYLSRTKYKSKAPWHDLSSSTSSSAPADGSVNNKSPKKSTQKHIFTTERAIVSCCKNINPQ